MVKQMRVTRALPLYLQAVAVLGAFGTCVYVWRWANTQGGGRASVEPFLAGIAAVSSYLAVRMACRFLLGSWQGGASTAYILESVLVAVLVALAVLLLWPMAQRVREADGHAIAGMFHR